SFNVWATRAGLGQLLECFVDALGVRFERFNFGIGAHPKRRISSSFVKAQALAFRDEHAGRRLTATFLARRCEFHLHLAVELVEAMEGVKRLSRARGDFVTKNCDFFLHTSTSLPTKILRALSSFFR